MRVRIVALVSVLISITFALPARATVVQFRFNGIVSNEVLQSGFYQDWTALNSFDPSWLGDFVSGVITMDLGLAHQSFVSPTVNQYSKTATHPFTRWLTVQVTNPDGTTVTVPTYGPPSNNSAPEADDALVQLQDDGSVDRFVVNRTNDHPDSYPRQVFGLQMSTLSGAGFVDGIDFTSTDINANLTNWDNYAWLRQSTGPGQGYQYSFAITQISRVVPEPGALLLLGIAGMAALRYARPFRLRTLPHMA